MCHILSAKSILHLLFGFIEGKAFKLAKCFKDFLNATPHAVLSRALNVWIIALRRFKVLFNMAIVSLVFMF